MDLFDKPELPGLSTTEAQSSKRRPAPRGTASYPRKRAVQACQVCRSRRTKCDNKKPTCSFCEKIGARCITSSVDLSSFDPASLKILERLDQLEDRLLGSQDAPISVGTDDPIPNEQVRDFHESRINIGDVLSWPVFEGRFDSHLDLKLLLRTISSDSVVSPGSFSPISYGDSKSTSNLLKAFLQYVHVKNPILDEAALHQMVRRLSLEGFGWDSESCLVLLVYSLGSIASPFNQSSCPDSDNLCRANSYFNASQRRIGTMLGKGGVLEAQCFFFSGVYLMSTLRPVHAWRHFVQALACCQEFEFATKSLGSGLATPSDDFRDPSAEESVYWACWKSELELRCHLELPDFSTKEHIYPRLFPSPPTETTQVEHREWYFYLAEISLRRLETRVRNDICHTRKPKNVLAYAELVEAIPSYENEIKVWIDSLPETMSLQTPETNDDVLKFVLRGHVMNFYEVIYWPFVEAVINQRQGSVNAKQYARIGLQYCCERIRLNHPGFTHRHHGTWLMIQSCTRSALVLLAAARSVDAVDLLPDQWKQTVFDTMGMLKFWEHDAGDAGDRLRILEDILESIHYEHPYQVRIATGAGQNHE